MLVHKTVKTMTDDELYQIYRDLEQQVISALQQFDRNNGTETDLIPAIIDAEGRLDFFESQCALLGRSTPQPRAFWHHD